MKSRLSIDLPRRPSLSLSLSLALSRLITSRLKCYRDHIVFSALERAESLIYPNVILFSDSL